MHKASNFRSLLMLSLNKSSECQLITDCKRGDSSAQKEIYNKYAALMLGVCLRYIKDKMEAEHVMVGGMVKVFKNISQFKEEGSFEGWVRRIMVNESLIYLRKNKKMSLMTDIDEMSEELSYKSFSAEIDTNQLLEMVHGLPEGYRTVFNLYVIEGYKHEEIGKKLGISVGTSKSQLNRARKLLQKRLFEIENINEKVSYGQ